MSAPDLRPTALKEASRVCGAFTLGPLVRRGDLVSLYLANAEGDVEARHVARVVHGLRPADSDRAEAFRKAIDALKELRHRAIPALVAGDVEGAEPVVITERVEAVTLRERLARESVDPQDLARMLVQVADALDALHRHDPGVVHRRLSPDNILVNDDGRAWLDEAGLAHALVEAGWSPDSVAPASPDYLTPDELKHRIRVRSDIFALATVAFECLTGITPFGADTDVARTAMILERERPSASALRGDVSRNVDAVFLRAWSTDECGALEPYTTAGALARELLRVLDAGVRPTLPPVTRSSILTVVSASVPPAEPALELSRESRDIPLEAEPLDDEPASEEKPQEVAAQAEAPAAKTEASAEAPAEMPSVVQTLHGVSAPPPEPDVTGAHIKSRRSNAWRRPPRVVHAAATSRASHASSPVTSTSPRVGEALASTTMTTEQERTIFPKNFGPSLVAAAAILAGAWIYVHKDDRPTPTPATQPQVEQQVGTLQREPTNPTPAPQNGTVPEIHHHTSEPTGNVPPPNPPPTNPPSIPPPTPVAAEDAGSSVAPQPTTQPPAPQPPTLTSNSASDAGTASATSDAAVAVGHQRPAQPPEAELRILRDMLQSEVRDCLAGANVPSVQVRVLYLGFNGHARSVSIRPTLDDPDKNVCIEQSIMQHPVPRFGSQTWSTSYTFSR